MTVEGTAKLISSAEAAKVVNAAAAPAAAAALEESGKFGTYFLGKRDYFSNFFSR